MLRPPSNPLPLAPLPEQLADRGCRPRTPAPVALQAERRTVVVAAHLAPADQVAFGEAEALRLQMALEPGHKAVSGLGERWLDACVGIEDHVAIGVPMAERQAGVPRCDMFLSLLRPVRLAVPDPAGRWARRRSRFLPLPSSARAFQPNQNVPPDGMFCSLGSRIVVPIINDL